MKTRSSLHARRAGALALSLAAVLGAHAQVATRSTLTALDKVEVPWGDLLALRADVAYSGPACPGGALPAMEGRMQLVASTQQLPPVVFDSPFFASQGRTCSGGNWNAQADFLSVGNLNFGAYVVVGRYTGGPTLAPSQSSPLIVRVNPQFSFVIPGGGGTVVRAGASGADGINDRCDLRQASLNGRTTLYRDLGSVPPPNMRYPYEHLTINAQNCVTGVAGGPGPIRQRVLAEFPDDIPPEAELWIHETSRDRPTPSWKRVFPPNLAFDGPFARTTMAGQARNATDFDRFILATYALAIPQRFAQGDDLQDLWWAGPDLSGWGLNVAKNGNRLFAVLFIYDDDGNPMWVVMPSGQWDPVHNVWYGPIYRPKGSPFNAYDAARLEVGDAIGTMSLSWSTVDEGNIDYVIDGVAGGTRTLRYVFGKREAGIPGRYAGIWWGGAAQEGWGLSIQQQGDLLFATWYTYGPDGKVTWFFMPGGHFTSATRFEGTLYKTTGARWVGANFDSSKVKATAVGTMSIDFTDDANNAMLTTTVNGVTQARTVSRFGF